MRISILDIRIRIIFLLYASARLLLLLCAVIIRYMQIVNGPILKSF
jgi:hypothetical protein